MKHKQGKKVVSLALTSLMAATALVGCGTSSEVSSSIGCHSIMACQVS